MDLIYFVASGVAILLASAAFFIFGTRQGKTAEVKRLAESKSTAEETAKRIVSDAEREAESTRKSALLAGKEEQIKLRESWEAEARHRREEIEREERPAGRAGEPAREEARTRRKPGQGDRKARLRPRPPRKVCRGTRAGARKTREPKSGDGSKR
jgi:hypothetical protein